MSCCVCCADVRQVLVARGGDGGLGSASLAAAAVHRTRTGKRLRRRMKRLRREQEAQSLASHPRDTEPSSSDNVTSTAVDKSQVHRPRRLFSNNTQSDSTTQDTHTDAAHAVNQARVNEPHGHTQPANQPPTGITGPAHDSDEADIETDMGTVSEEETLAMMPARQRYTLGEAGQSRELLLELKLLADVGFVVSVCA